MSKKESIFSSFGFAGSGVKDALRDEPNFRIHIIVGTLALILGFVFKFSTIEFAILILTETIVIVAELINTALENIVDIVSPEKKEEARIAKDVSAAFVLIAAFSSSLVGLLLFLPRIFRF